MADAEAADGRVTFVGAGPGHGDPLTSRAARAIADADVVIRPSGLARAGVIEHTREGAEILDGVTMSPEQVAAVYARAAAEGLRVARIHLGDAVREGRTQEEVDLCAGLGVETEIVPGVSLVLVPGVSLVVGVGAGKGAPAEEIVGLIEEALVDAGLSAACVAALATVDTKAAEPGIVEAAARFGVPVLTYSADELAGVDVPNPSDAPLTTVGTPSVAEAAALLGGSGGGCGSGGSGGGGELLVPKRKSAPGCRAPRVTCAIVRCGPVARAPRVSAPDPNKTGRTIKESE